MPNYHTTTNRKAQIMCETCETETLPALNVKLMKDLLTWARQDQSKIENIAKFKGWGTWEQESWAKEVRNGVCRSSYCMAGQAVVQAGYGLKYENTDEDWDGNQIWSASECAPQRVIGTNNKGEPMYELVNEATEYIETAAARVLGLTRYEADLFFHADNSISDLERLAAEFARKRALDANFD